MAANPLNDLALDGSINQAINQHFEHFPLDQNLFHDNLYKVYHVQFVLGLLSSIVSNVRARAKKHIFVRRMENNLRIFAFVGSKVHFHNIFYDEPTIDGEISWQIVTPNELRSLQKLNNDFNLKMAKHLPIQNYLYGLNVNQDERFSIDLLLLGYKSLKPKEISQMPLEQMSGNNLLDSDHSVELHRIPSNKDVFFFIKDTQKSFSLKNLRTTIGYIYPTEALDHFTQNEPIAKAGYMQGFVFKSIPDSYYTKLRESPLPMVSFNDGVLSICLPLVVEPNEFAMFNFGRKNQAAHRLLFGTKNEDLIIHQVNIDTESTNEYKDTDTRIIKFALGNILDHMRQDILVAKDFTHLQDYVNTIHGFLRCFDASNVEPDTLKAFLLGLLKTSPDLNARYAFKRHNDELSIEALFLKHGPLEYLLTFDQTRETYPNMGSVDTFSKVENDMLHLNLAVSSEKFEISTSATSFEEAAKIFDLDHGNSFNLKNVLEQALKNNELVQFGPIRKHLELIFHNLVGESMRIMEVQTDFGYYLAGLLAHFKYMQQHSTTLEMMARGMGIVVPVQVDGEEHSILIYITWRHLGNNIAELIVPFGKISPTHSLSIAYDLKTKTIALFGLNSNTAKLNTENVESVCQRGSRRKRGSSSACSYFYNEEENQIIVDDEAIKKAIETKEPVLNEHLSRIYELTGKIQMGFLARDFVGDLVQGDTKALVRDGFFFGGNLLAQKVGSMAAEYGEKVASKALSRSVMSFGLCLPKLAFDGYMAYQMVQQIKNNDTVGAVTTGAFMAIDMAECALQALVTFGLITLNPLVLPVMAIASTLLLIGMNFYDAMKEVKEIDHVVHLSSEEYTYEFVREFFHAGTDAYIQHVMDEKQANQYIVSKLSENYPNIKRFLISAAIMKEDKSISFIDDNEVDLSKMHTFHDRSRAMPEVTNAQSLFCMMSEEPHEKSMFQKIVDYALYSNVLYTLTLLFNRKTWQQFQDFYCHNAYGVSMLNASHSEKTMFLLFDGNDNVTGFQYASNIFQIGNGSKLILGGDHDDYFKLTGGAMTGSLNGANGYDTVDFSEYGHNKLVSIRGNVVKLFQGGETFSLKNIESVVGRRNTSDIIYICNENRIDLGGSLNNPDQIFITENEDEKCLPPTNLTIYLRKDTHVTCTSEEAKVTYLVDRDSRGTVKTESGSHHFYFQGLKLTDIGRVEFNGTSFSLEFGSNGGQLTINDASNVSIEFEDHIRMRLLNGTFMAYMDGQESVFHIIEKYSQYI